MDIVVANIKEKLHHYIDNVEERKLQAIYIMLENEIEQVEDYTDEFKTKLDERLAAYQSNGVTVTEQEANQRINNLLQKLKSE